MSLQAGELVVRIVAAAGSDLESSVTSQVNAAADSATKTATAKLESIGKRAGELGNKMSIAATLPLLAVAKTAVDAASSTVEATNKTNVVFGKASASVIDFADSSAKAFGISRLEALDAASTFGNLFRTMGVGRKTAAETATTMTGLAGDLASFNDADPSEVLGALQAGLLGEAEPLRRFGVSLSAAREQSEALALGLVKPTKNAALVTAANLKVEAAAKAAGEANAKYGKDSTEAAKAANDLELAQQGLTKVTKGSVPALTDAQKLQARQSIILKDSKLAQGDFQRSLSTSAANQQRVSKALASDSQAAIGQQLLPLYQQGIIKVGQLAEAFGKLSPEAKRNVVVLGGIVAAAGPVLKVFQLLTTVGSGAIKGIAAGAKGAKAAVDAAKRLGQGYRDAQAAQSAFSGSAGTLGGKLKSTQTALVNSAKAAGTWAAQTAKSAATAARSVASAALAQARALASSALQYAKVAAAAVASAAKQVAIRAATLAQAAALQVLKAAQIAAAVTTRALSLAMAFLAANPIVLVIAALVAAGIALVVLYKKSETFRNIVNAVFGAVRDFVTGAIGFVVNFVKNHWQLLLAIIAGPLGLIIGLVIKNFGKIRAVTTVAFNAVRAIVAKVMGTLGGLVRGALSAVTGGFNAAKGAVVGAANAIKSGVVGAFNALKSAVTNVINRVGQAAGQIKGKVTGALSGAADFLRTAGQNIVQGLINGIGDFAQKAYDKISELASGIKDKAVGVLKIFSPSRVFYAIGAFIVQGLTNGIAGTADEAVAASEDLANRVADAYEKRADERDKALKKAKATAKSKKAGAGAKADARAQIKALTAEAKNDKRRKTALLALIKTQRSGQVELAKRHDQLLADLSTARDNLAGLQQQAVDYAKGVTDALVQASNITTQLPEGVALTTDTLIDRLTQQVARAKEFAANIDRLRGLGLNTTTLDQIVQAGADAGGQYAAELAGATQAQIAQLNGVQADLAATGQRIGTSAAHELYDASIAAAAAYVSQLETQEAQLAAQQQRLAKAFADSVLQQLGITRGQIAAGPGKGDGGGKGGKGGKGGGKNGPKGGGKQDRVQVDAGGPSQVINTTVNNPKPEPAGSSVPKRLRRLKQSGALK